MFQHQGGRRNIIHSPPKHLSKIFGPLKPIRKVMVLGKGLGKILGSLKFQPLLIELHVPIQSYIDCMFHDLFPMMIWCEHSVLVITFSKHTIFFQLPWLCHLRWSRHHLRRFPIILWWSATTVYPHTFTRNNNCFKYHPHSVGWVRLQVDESSSWIACRKRRLGEGEGLGGNEGWWRDMHPVTRFNPTKDTLLNRFIYLVKL